MKKFFILGLLAICTIFFANSVNAASITEHPNIAVLKFKNKAAIPKAIALKDASMVSDLVFEQLTDANCFKIIEREYLEDVLKEYSYNMSGIIDPSTAVQLGKQIGVSFLMVGSITGLSTSESGIEASDSEKGSIGGTKKAVVANISVRFIDVETGEVVLAASGTGKSSRAKAELTLKKKYYDDYETTTVNDDGIESVSDGKDFRLVEKKITIGSDQFTQTQVRNALYKAVGDVIYNKNYGIIAKLEGKSKRRKV